MKIKTLADLTPDPKNARKHNPRNIGMIAESLGKVGASRSIVIDEDGNILAGNGTVEALAEVGIHKVRVIETDGEEIVAVMRKGLTPEQKTQLAIADNRTAELAEWDIPVLKELEIEIPGLLDNMFTPVELDDLYKLDIDIGPQEGEDDAPEPPEEPVTKAGDLYQLGEHRLLCGDSSNPIIVSEFLPENGCDGLLTDPPYGIGEAAGKNKSRGGVAFAGKGKNTIVASKDYGYSQWDDKPISESHLELIKMYCKSKIIFGGNYYPMPPSSCWLVWDKDNGNCDFADCELVWTNLKKAVRMIKHRWHGMLQENMAQKEERVHPTQKPVGVIEWCIGHLPDDCQTIFDPFGGSGSTLIACEKLDRKCYMMEIDPAYCDVIVKRWEDFTGKKAELIVTKELQTEKEVVTNGIAS